MANITKTVGTSLAAWQDVATANVVPGAAADVSTKLAASVFAKVCRKSSGTAYTAGWPNIRIEASAVASVNGEWYPVAIFQPPVTAGNTTTLNGAILAGASSFVVTSATGIAVGSILFIGDASPANYEFVRVAGVSGTTITPEDHVVNAHTNGANVTTLAAMFMAQIDLTSIARLRAVIDNGNSGQTIVAEILMVTGDSIG